MTTSLLRTVAFGLLAMYCFNKSTAQNYRIERIASNLDQPTYVTQAPGDPANILYYTERTTDAIPGFGADNEMGQVWRYDVDARSRTLVLDLSDREVTNDTGLQTIAFHPDFNVPGTPGYGKMFVSSSERGPTANNRVEQYSVDVGGDSPTYAAALDRVVLNYANNSENNHTVNWVGFDPTATGQARNYLYISTGDGSFGLSQRPSQNPNDVRGKLLRVDVSGGDDYPLSDFKNFAIPPDNPLPRYNADNPGEPIAGLGEVFLTGIRNSSRVSFDRLTGDIYMGDVGEVDVEEVNFYKAGSNPTKPPFDYGWAQREGTESGIVAPFSKTNPITNVPAIDPIYEFDHTQGGNAVIGGYVYRGPVQELQGLYFFTDFVQSEILSLDFDRDTPIAEFDGNNGAASEVTDLWNSLVVDPTDPSYTPEIGELYGIDKVVSFGEDNAGNLYIVDFGFGFGFNGQYPGAGLGEIFRVTLIPEPSAAAMLAAGLAGAIVVRRRRAGRRRTALVSRGP